MFGDKKNKITDSERSLISETVSVEGTINSSGAIDVAGLVKGPVFSKQITIMGNNLPFTSDKELSEKDMKFIDAPKFRQWLSKSTFLGFSFKMQGSDFLRTSHAKLLFLLLYSRCRWHRFPQKWSFCSGHPHKIEKYTI